MNLIKLNAIPSTNEYLKELATFGSLKNFTIVEASNQTNGKGQRGNSWITEPNTNLTFSLWIDNLPINKTNLFIFNILVANSILEALQTYKLSGLSIKWPNDILSYSKKIGGILIENFFKSDAKIQSIVGIGINLMQNNFDGLPKASSIWNSYQIEIDKYELIEKIVRKIQMKLKNLDKNNQNEWRFYHDNLFRINIASMFKTSESDKPFLGIIKHVDSKGLLHVETQSKENKAFDLKEIQMLY